MQRKYIVIVMIYFCVFFFSGILWNEIKDHEYTLYIKEFNLGIVKETVEFAMHRRPVNVYIDTSVILVVVVSVYYVSKAMKKILLVVIHEPHKNIKQLPRCSIDNRTHVRYNRIIATLVRAVMGGTENGRR